MTARWRVAALLLGCGEPAAASDAGGSSEESGGSTAAACADVPGWGELRPAQLDVEVAPQVDGHRFAVAMQADGSHAIASMPPSAVDSRTILVQRFDPAGLAIGDAFAQDVPRSAPVQRPLAFAATADGGWALAWIETGMGALVMGRTLAADGTASDVAELYEGVALSGAGIDLAATADAIVLVLDGNGIVRARFFDATLAPTGAAIDLSDLVVRPWWLDAAAAADGTLAAAWTTIDTSDFDPGAMRRFDAGGAIGSIIAVGADRNRRIEIVAMPDGFALAYVAGTIALERRDLAGALQGAPRLLGESCPDPIRGCPALAAQKDGALALAWPDADGTPTLARYDAALAPIERVALGAAPADAVAVATSACTDDLAAAWNAGTLRATLARADENGDGEPEACCG
jgi:hypothetical protein